MCLFQKVSLCALPFLFSPLRVPLVATMSLPMTTPLTPPSPLWGRLLPLPCYLLLPLPLYLIWVSSIQFVHHTLILFVTLYVPLHRLGMLLLQCQRILFHLLQILFQIANPPIQLWSLPLWSLPEDTVAFVKPKFDTAKTGTMSRDC